MTSPGILFLVLSWLLLCLLTQAWGPGTHLDFALRLLRRKKHRIPAKTYSLLRNHEEEFLYGNIAADIINFKSFGGPKHDCHKWDVIDRMQAHAKKPGEKAFVLGFLTHLAADTIAHNHYVPYHLARFAKTKAGGHLYWEMAADRFVPESHWKKIDSLKKNRDLDRLDNLINAAVRKKVFSMRTNKILFNHLTLIHARDRWRKTLAGLKLRDMPRLPESRLDKFRRAALERMVTVLQKDGRQLLEQIDPSGKDAQKQSMKSKRKLLTRFKGRKQLDREAEEIAQEYLKGMDRKAG